MKMSTTNVYAINLFIFICTVDEHFAINEEAVPL